MKEMLKNKKCRSGSPADMLMRGHHNHGGEATPLASQTKVNSNPSNHYKRGGHCHRDMGGPMGEMPPVGAMTMKSLRQRSMPGATPASQQKNAAMKALKAFMKAKGMDPRINPSAASRIPGMEHARRRKFTTDMGMPGGQAGMQAGPAMPGAEGAAPEAPMKRGGRARRHHGREHHFLGLLAGLLPSIVSGISSLFSDDKDKGEEEEERRRGGRVKRRGHLYGGPLGHLYGGFPGSLPGLRPNSGIQSLFGNAKEDEEHRRGGRVKRRGHFDGGHAGRVSEAILRELGGTDIHNDRNQNQYGEFHFPASTTRVARKNGGRTMHGSEHHVNPAAKLMRGSKQHADGEKDPAHFRHKPSTTRVRRAMGGVAKERKDFPFT